jgi:hypothetical protein
MEPKPVEHSHPPAYPTRREVLAGTATFALASLARCVFVYSEGPAGKVSVAPIFEHGEGRGATGCIVIVPPVFLSEEESLQVVNEALAQHGVKLVRGTVVKELMIDPRCMQAVETDGTKEKAEAGEKATVPDWPKWGSRNYMFVEDVGHSAALRFTGMDEKSSIAVAFVCQENYQASGGVDPDNGRILTRDGNLLFCTSSVSHYDFKDAAKYLAAEIADADKSRRRWYVGVLYDPVAEPKRDGDKKTGEPPQSAKSDREAETAESKELLRQQAQEFAAWLKRQGAF